MFQLLDQLCPLFERDEMRLVLLSHASIVSHGKIAMELKYCFSNAQPGFPESIRLWNGFYLKDIYMHFNTCGMANLVLSEPADISARV